MDDDLPGFDEGAGWIAVAGHHEPIAFDPHPVARTEARRALALALLSIVCLGFVLGPLALAMGQRAELAIGLDPKRGDASVARAAITIGRVAFMVHLMALVTALPWLLFALPLAQR